ncbi:MAG: riboflavin biosynthesis protein RibD, partial [Planctomycetes bacterium]|nr:riboflavin biosynthesis protein RibD [Planctomycetota bacterium]
MRRALRLASLSLGRTWPNPGVACVLMRDGRLIGQGRHERCGEAHAEVLALRDAERRGGA